MRSASVSWTWPPPVRSGSPTRATTLPVLSTISRRSPVRRAP
ncbi:hypothetical protein OV079_07060 [Nannocystis pusilla]|uniref:Uncharacterized protein n=1 Tax=Nannocystis pusilla TaxID=889268 RepID=A0A9X3ELG1_9BACT|nr:hypothetical protein [Nannocystis pusilla]MCY1005334.1 hypothetical protein [Nannocystis pusilla]